MNDPGRPGSARRVFWLTLVGTLLLQTAWMMSVPGFRGPDEFDHAYKVAAVAHGQLRSEGPAKHGRGGVVTVPLDLVRSAARACESRDYTGHDNCHPIDEPTPGTARVATAADSYNPAYYAVVGVVTRWLPGADLGPGMRLATALLAALLLAWGAATTTRWSRSRWPLLAYAVATTPTLIYSTVIISPNGVHYAAAMLTWAAALGLARDQLGATRYLLPFTVGAAVMVSTHTTGPMWLALTCLLVLLLRPLRWWYDAVRAASGPWLLGVLATGAATFASLAWIRLAHTNNLGAADPTLPALRVGHIVSAEILWPFQTVGAFPMRDDPAPWLVYVVWFTGFIVLCALGLARAARRARWAALLLVVLVLTVPAVLTAISFASSGLAWQGRYGLPLSIGMPLLAGWCLDRNPVRMSRNAPLLAGVAFGAANLVSVLHVATKEMREFPVDPVAGTFTGGLVLIALLALAGPVLSAGLTNRPPPSPVQEPEREEVLVG